MKDSDVLAITHTARMLQRLGDTPDHVRASEYRRQIKVYAGQWAALTDLEQADAKDAAFAVPDMTPDTVTAAIAALEN